MEVEIARSRFFSVRLGVGAGTGEHEIEAGKIFGTGQGEIAHGTAGGISPPISVSGAAPTAEKPELIDRQTAVGQYPHKLLSHGARSAYYGNIHSSLKFFAEIELTHGVPYGTFEQTKLTIPAVRHNFFPAEPAFSMAIAAKSIKHMHPGVNAP